MGVYAAGIEGRIAVLFVPMHALWKLANGSVTLGALQPGEAYEVLYFDPISGAERLVPEPLVAGDDGRATLPAAGRGARLGPARAAAGRRTLLSSGGYEARGGRSVAGGGRRYVSNRYAEYGSSQPLPKARCMVPAAGSNTMLASVLPGASASGFGCWQIEWRLP